MTSKMETKMPIHPCQGCIYYKACGESTRTEPCNGRMTKREKNNEKNDRPQEEPTFWAKNNEAMRKAVISLLEKGRTDNG